MGCNISGACDAMKMVRQSFYNWKANNREFAIEVEEAKERIIDYVESKLMVIFGLRRRHQSFFPQDESEAQYPYY